MQLRQSKVLYIDDEDFIRKAAVSYLSFYYENVLEAKDGLEGLEVYEKEKPDIIITDIKMPRLNGLEMVRKIRQKDKETKVIIATAFLDQHYLLQAIELHLVKYLQKPIKEATLMPVLNACELELVEQDNIVYLSKTLRYDLFNKVLFKEEEQVFLPKKEALLLHFLIKNHERVVSYKELENSVWDGVMSETALRTAIRDIRLKTTKGCIKNISGVGYQIVLC